MVKNWYNIENKAGSKSADIFIYSEIGGFDVNAQKFIEQLKDLKNKDLNVYINSLGGSVFDGMAIYNALKNHAGKVTTKVQGIAASIASVIVMAGDSIEMAKNSLFMIHNPFTMAGGDANELRKTATILDKIRDEIADIYQSKSIHDMDTMMGLMDSETWFNAEETIEGGFANEITKAIKVENNYKIDDFCNITMDKINKTLQINNNQNQKSEIMANLKEDKTLLEKIKSLLISTPVKNAEGDEDTPAEDVDWALTYEELKDRVVKLEEEVAALNDKAGMSADEEEDEAGDDEAENKAQLETANSEIVNLTNEISKLKASGTNVAKANETEIIENKVVDPNLNFFNTMAEAIKLKA